LCSFLFSPGILSLIYIGTVHIRKKVLHNFGFSSKSGNELRSCKKSMDVGLMKLKQF